MAKAHAWNVKLRFGLTRLREASGRYGASYWDKVKSRVTAGLQSARTRFNSLKEKVAAGPNFTEGQWNRSAKEGFAAFLKKSLRGHLVMLIVFSAAMNILMLSPSIFMMQVYDRVLPTRGLLTLVLLSFILVFALVIMATLEAQRTKILTRASMRIERLSSELLMRQSMNSDQSGGGAKKSNGIRDLDTLRAGVTSPAVGGFLDLPFMPIYIIACFMLHPAMGVLSIAGAVLILGVALANERASRENLADMSAQSAMFYASHDAYGRSQKTIRALGAEEALVNRRLKARATLVQAQSETAFKSAFFASAAKAVRMILQSASLALGCFLAIEQQMSPGSIVAVSILTARAYAPVEQIVGGWRQIGQAIAAFKSMCETVDAQAESNPRTPLPSPAGGVRVRDISALSVDGRSTVLRNVSMDAEPGEVIGILGPSGAGKSTLARILANADAPTHGEVRIDGARYRDWEPSELAQHIGYLPQGLDLMDGTIAENICSFMIVSPEMARERGKQVVDAAKLAGAHDLILSLPQAYETRLGLSGAGLSPGQAQRVALARAVFGKPKVVVLDEPNAHLDGDGDTALVSTMADLKKAGIVTFIVAHRMNTVASCDKLLVLREGRVWEFGPKDAVLAKMSSHTKQPAAALVASR